MLWAWEQGVETELQPLKSGISDAGVCRPDVTQAPCPCTDSTCAPKLPPNHYSTVPQPGPIGVEGRPCRAAAVSGQIRGN